MTARPRTWTEIEEARSNIVYFKDAAARLRVSITQMQNEDTTGYDARDMRLLAEDIARSEEYVTEYETRAERIEAFLTDEMTRYGKYVVR